MTLSEGQIGRVYKVKSLKMEDKLTRRLECMGLIEKTPIKILNRKKSGVLVLMVRGTRLAMGKEIAGGIDIYE